MVCSVSPMMKFLQICIQFSVLEIQLNDVEYDYIECIYQGNTMKITEIFKIVIKTLNDLIFSSVHIIFLKKYKNFLGFNRSVENCGVKIGLRDILKVKNGVQEFDIIPINDLQSAEYFDKNPPVLGTIKIKVETIPLNTLLEDKKINGLVQNVINRFFSAEFTESIKAIKDVTSFILQGSTVCNLKAAIGMVIIDGILIKRIECKEEETHTEMDGCFITNCLKGYGLISPEESLDAMKCINYCLGSYLDSKMWKLIVKPELSLPNIKDKKLRAVLERINIPEHDFIKYFEGNHKIVGFIMFKAEGTLVISFRGTLSHHDIINDLDASYAQFYNGYAHSGILKLSNKFIDNELDGIIDILKANQLKKILLTGHSLGGAVATIVHLRITKDNLISDLSAVKTISFASPPTVSEVFIDENIENLTTYNFGNDIITRLSVGALLDFKYLCISIANIFNIFSKSDSSIERILMVRKFLKSADLYPKLYHPGIVYHIKDANIESIVTYGFKRVDPRLFADLIIHKDYPISHILTKHISAFKYCIEKKPNDKMQHLN